MFEGGEIAAVEEIPADDCRAAFPDLTFNQLLMEVRSLEDLRYAFADCWVGGDERRALLDALLPKGPSRIARLA